MRGFRLPQVLVQRYKLDSFVFAFPEFIVRLAGNFFAMKMVVGDA
jgi:hypothetical protein